MVKKILSLVLVSLMMAVPVAFADTDTNNIWTEDFTGASVGELTEGVSINGTDFTLINVYNSSNTSVEVKHGVAGKKNNDAALMFEDVNARTDKILYKEFNTPYELSEDTDMVNIGFDWISYARNVSNDTHPKRVILGVTLDDSTEKEVIVALMAGPMYETDQSKAYEGKITANTIKNDFTYGAADGAWNRMELYVAKDKVYMWNIDAAEWIETDISTWSDIDGTSLAGKKISKINSLKLQLDSNRSSNFRYRLFGFDNFIAKKVDSKPATIKFEQPYFLDFTNIASGHTFSNNKLATMDEVYERGKDDVVTYSVPVTKEDSNTAANVSSELYISSEANAATYKSAYVGFRFTPDVIMRPAAGDKVQYSFDIMLDDNNDNQGNLFELLASLYNETSSEIFFNIKSDGTVNNGNGIGKLDAGKYYNVDVLITMHDSIVDGTIGSDITAEVYINGKLEATKVLHKKGATYSENDFMFDMIYRAQVDEGIALANGIHLDNICYNVFSEGETVHNFDRSLDKASNKVLAGAEEDVTECVISAVAPDWTVADFKAAANLDNMKVLTADKTAEADNNASIVGCVLEFTSDYRAPMYYTVSSNGATQLTTEHLVIAKQGGDALVNGANITVGEELSAKAYVSDGNSVIIAAEYDAGNNLVGVTVGASYTPKAAGNTVKLFVWDSVKGLTPVAPMTTLNVVADE